MRKIAKRNAKPSLEEDIKKLITIENKGGLSRVIYYHIIQDSPSKFRVLTVNEMTHGLYCINGFTWNPKNEDNGTCNQAGRFTTIYHSSWGDGIKMYDYEVGKLLKDKKRWSSEYYSFEEPPSGYKLRYIPEKKKSIFTF